MRVFRPAIFSTFHEYRRADFFGDLSAGVTVGIIALPLAIGFGIASGVTPQQGLWTGWVGCGASRRLAFSGGRTDRSFCAGIVIFRMRNIPAMDASGLHAFRVAIEKLHRDGVKIFLTAVQPQPMKVMFESGLVSWLGEHKFCADLDQALAASRQALAAS